MVLLGELEWQILPKWPLASRNMTWSSWLAAAINAHVSTLLPFLTSRRIIRLHDQIHGMGCNPSAKSWSAYAGGRGKYTEPTGNLGCGAFTKLSQYLQQGLNAPASQ
jgi:hypothetical protein